MQKAATSHHSRWQLQVNITIQYTEQADESRLSNATAKKLCIAE